MYSGKLRHRITIQIPAGVRDAVGERITTWTDVATVWARINPLSVRELLAAGELHSETSHKITIRYSSLVSSVDASCRVLYGTRIFVLQGPPRNIDEANHTLEFLCSEGLREE